MFGLNIYTHDKFDVIPTSAVCVKFYQIRSGNPRRGELIFKVLFTLQRVH